MRITILTIGSRGDVQPYVALGLGLKAAGHDVKVATASNFAGLVGSYGLEFAPLEGDMLQLMQSELGLQAMERGNIIGFLRKAIDAMEPMIDQMAHDALEACRDADAIVAATSMVFPAEALSQYLGIPYVPSYPQPILPTRDYQSMAFPPAPSWLGPLKGTYNRLSHQIMLQILWQLMRSPSNRVRRRMGLPTLPLFASLKDIWKGEVPVLYCFSPNVVAPTTDHGENVNVSGYWFLDRPANWQPPADLLAFLESGPAPVYIGFGSMTDRNPEELTKIALKALAAAGQRGVLLSGWGGIGKKKLLDNVFVIDSAPHDWLFPKMSAIVHHGGAGTTAASLRAGVPPIIIPFIADQPFWGERVHKLGVGPAPIPRKQLTAAALAQAIHTAVTDKEMRSRAAALGECIRSENGVQVAVDMIERYLDKTAYGLSPSERASFAQPGA